MSSVEESSQSSESPTVGRPHEVSRPNAKRSFSGMSAGSSVTYATDYGCLKTKKARHGADGAPVYVPRLAPESEPLWSPLGPIPGARDQSSNGSGTLTPTTASRSSTGSSNGRSQFSEFGSYSPIDQLRGGRKPVPVSFMDRFGSGTPAGSGLTTASALYPPAPGSFTATFGSYLPPPLPQSSYLPPPLPTYHSASGQPYGSYPVAAPKPVASVSSEGGSYEPPKLCDYTKSYLDLSNASKRTVAVGSGKLKAAVTDSSTALSKANVMLSPMATSSEKLDVSLGKWRMESRRAHEQLFNCNLVSYKFQGPINSIAHSADGKLCAVACRSGLLRVYNTSLMRQWLCARQSDAQMFSEHPSHHSHLVDALPPHCKARRVSPFISTKVSYTSGGAPQGKVHPWYSTVSTRMDISEMSFHKHPTDVMAVAGTRCGQLALLTLAKEKQSPFGAKPWRIVKSMANECFPIRTVQFHPANYNLLFAAGSAPYVRLYDVTRLSVVESHKFVPIAEERAERERRRAARKKKPIGQAFIGQSTRFGVDDNIVSLRVTPTGNMLATCNMDGNINFYDGRTMSQVLQIANAHGGEAVRQICLSTHSRGVVTVDSHLSRYLVSSGDDYRVKLWDLRTGKQRMEYAVPFRKEDRATLKELVQDLSHLCPFSAATHVPSFSPSPDRDSSEELRRRPKAAKLRASDNGTRAVLSFDNAYVIASDGSNRLNVYETATGRRLSRLRDHRHKVLAVARSPTDSSFVTGAADARARFYFLNRHSRRCKDAPLRSHRDSFFVQKDADCLDKLVRSELVEDWSKECGMASRRREFDFDDAYF